MAKKFKFRGAFGGGGGSKQSGGLVTENRTYDDAGNVIAAVGSRVLPKPYSGVVSAANRAPNVQGRPGSKKPARGSQPTGTNVRAAQPPVNKRPDRKKPTTKSTSTKRTDRIAKRTERKSDRVQKRVARKSARVQGRSKKK